MHFVEIECSDSMCLLSICKQLFAEKVALRKEAMKAVLEWDIGNSDRSRAQVEKHKFIVYFYV